MSTTLYIPVRNSHPPESVAVPLSSLPSDPSDLIGVLTNELAPPSLWLRLALSYFSSQASAAYLDLLSAITADDATAAYNQPEVNNAAYTADRIAILCSLAGYSTYSAYSHSLRDTPHQRTLMYQQALQHLNAATALDYRHTLIWSCRALLALCQGDVSEALSHANEAIRHDKLKTNTLALLLKAICLYHRQRYADAAKHLQAALQNNSELPAGSMLGLALCHYAGKDVAASVRVLRAVLEREPDNVDALAVLAVIELNEVADAHKQQLQAQQSGGKSDASSPSSSSVAHALSLLVRAFELNPSHPLTLVHLASHLFYMGEHDTCMQLANRALSLLDASHHGLRSEAHFQLARCHHVRLDFAQAAQYYALGKQEDEQMQRKQRAVVAAAGHTSAAPQPAANDAPVICSHPLLLLGHAQMLLLRSDLNAALPLLAHLHAAHPSDVDVQRLLALTNLQLGQFASAEPLLAQLLHSSPYDVELLCAHAHACEQISGKKQQAKADCIEAVRVIREEEEESKQQSDEQTSGRASTKRVPMQLLNNLAVVSQELGDMEGAKRYYEEALRAVEEEASETEERKEAEEGNSDGKVVPASVTIRYNLALLNERAAPPSTPLADLSAPYLSLIAAFPSYTDPYLRLGTLHASHSAYSSALSFFQQALQRHDKHLEGRTLLAQLYVRQGNVREAEKEYNNIALWTVTGKAPEDKGKAALASEADDEEEELKGDTYAKLALGNLYLHQARLLSAAVAAHAAASPNTPPPTPGPASLVVKVTRSKAEKGGLTAAYWQSKAGRYFRSVLSSDATNLYAAHGLGCLLAEQGEYAKAKDVLMAVREASASEGYVDVVLNLGHIHVQQGQYAPGVKCYEDVINKLLPAQPTQRGEEDAQIAETRTNAHLYLARAYYLWGQMDDSLAALDQAVLARPNSALVWYDRALAQEEYAVSVLRKKSEERTLGQVRTAVARLTEAEATFNALAAAGKRKKQRDEEEKRKEKERKRRDKEAANTDEEKKADSEQKEQQPEGETASTGSPSTDPTSTASASSTLPLSGDSSAPLVCPPAEALSLDGCLFPLYDKASAHAVYCAQTLEKAAAHLAAAEKREAELEARGALVKRQKEEMAEAARRETDERLQAERGERERADAVAQENKAKLAALQDSWESERRQEKEDESDDAAEDGEGRERGKKSKGRGKKKAKRAGSGSDEEADEERGGGRRRNKRQRAERSEAQGEAEETTDAQLAAEEEEAAAEAVAEEPEEWQRLRQARARQAGMKDILPAPEHESREGQEQATEVPRSEDAADEVADSAVADAQPRNRRSRIRRAGAAQDEEDEEVRGLDEEDPAAEQAAEDDGKGAEAAEEQAVEAEEGREAETEQMVSEAVEMRKAGRRKAIVEDEEAEAEQEETGAAEGAEDEAVEMNVSHAAENEAPIRKAEGAHDKLDEAKQQALDAMERQSVSATAMDTND